eukprot:CAMPEP_0170138642 /NCGR_PEP_ID=MMETSP0033_2-20121228/5075_1 /TAXON_ID=195969 /ORGANISM="Dolichomastix tenuilepis, Strain CCMP3274" /LENGTH=141 /DNA_ID=CAMNT_0010374669 /DNA_START=15 /DNA_END=440 /DNA_ORIENTATION=+
MPGVECLDDAALAEVLAKLEPQHLVLAAGVSRSFARAAEGCFKAICHRRQLRLPQSRRRALSSYRRLYATEASCYACGKSGEFVVRPSRLSGSGRKLFLLCRSCLSEERVQRRLTERSLHVDLEGVSGALLVPKYTKWRRK